jgi:hypothetical protein
MWVNLTRRLGIRFSLAPRHDPKAEPGLNEPDAVCRKQPIATGRF